MKVRSTLELLPVLRDGSENCVWRVPVVAPIDLPQRDLPLDPYLLGVLLGDGALSHSVEFTPGDDDVPREVERVLPPGVRLVRKASKTRAQAWAISGMRYHDNPVLTALRDLGLHGKLSHEKFVPEQYLFASIEQRQALLQGLMDTDGELHGKQKRFVGFSSSSLALVEAVRFLVESLGGLARFGVKLAPRYRHKGEIRIGRPSYRLTISMPDDISPFRARPGYQNRPKYKPARLIRSIEPEGAGEVVCISVDAPNQLYVTEHCIVTHNTLSMIMSHDPHDGPLVVICPAMVRPVWIGWLKRVFPDEPIGVLAGRTFDPKVLEHKLVVGHYDVLNWWQSIRSYGTVVFDEAHALTNRGAKRSKAAVALASRAHRVICATGTPIWNLPPDLWNVLAIVAPGAFGGYHEFALRYGDPEPTAHGTKYRGISNEDELRARLTEVMIRRRWVDVQADLPPISRNVSLVELDQATSRKLDILAATIMSDKSSTIGHLARYREQLSRIKAPAVVREATTMLDRGEPVVIWTWHVALAEKIAQELGERAFLLTGEVSGPKRDEAIAKWNEHPAAALVCTMSVAQVGLDFSHAHLAIFAEIDYTPAILSQAEMRTYAPSRPMNITYVVANHLIDHRIVMALTKKLAAANPLGVEAASETISALDLALNGPEEVADMDRLLADILESC
jgi:hypothetical protein